MNPTPIIVPNAMGGRPVDISERVRAQQIEQKQKEAAIRASKLESIAKRFVDILCEEGCTAEDFGMIAGGIDKTIQAKFSTFTFDSIINHGGQPTIRTEREAEQPGPGGPGEGQREADKAGVGDGGQADAGGSGERTEHQPDPGSGGSDPGQDRTGGDAPQ